jgi:acyl carrier protein
VETVLQAAPGIRQAVVLADRDGADTRRLVGYVVADDSFDKDGVNAYLNSRLPEYMVPALLVPLEVIPLTSNGKADRKQLAAMALVVSNSYEAPRNDMEKKLAAIWLNLLRVESIGVYDRFFEVGGHSLLAMRVIAAIRKEFGKEVTIREFFDNPTIALLAERLLADKGNSARPVIGKYDKAGHIPLSFSQERIWVIDKLRGSQDYHMPYVLRL